eukprot:CAMPEP_0170164262 /NCGR_PEP_ID=MMETSP0033_2-20121228/78015_1 /TAXON_ID=195969 /ORGANISM="Dolichomastix tenuilepis, Strain CCMP3274" /LENGTH=268 /DNA_ID=CAMNT_0010401903 /DNA_START=426 /DNA_END=1232 /DNA_ORIENTATION=-
MSLTQARVLSGARVAQRNVRRQAGARAVAASAAADRPMWWVGADAPAHLDGSMPGDFGFDPLGLGSNAEDLAWYREAELQHCRWAMWGTAGVLAQEIVKPDVFWYNAATSTDLPFDILGIVSVQFLLMHYVETRRFMDFKNPGSVDVDPIFEENKLPAHEAGYPGGIFDVAGFSNDGADLTEMKVKELKNGRLAMLGFAGFIMQAQATGEGPLKNLADHIASPGSTNVFAKAVVTPSIQSQLTCKIPPLTEFQGIDIPTPCFLEALWP